MAESDAVVDNPISPAAEGMLSNRNKAKISSKLKDAILAQLAASNPSMPISPDLIQLRLQQFFPTFHTPIHPPYSSMIQQAILKLNNEGGSSEEAILRFIEKEYEGLPWGHASFLSHHLEKVCRNGDILCVNDGRFILQVNDGDLGHEEEKMSHILNITNRDGKEDQTFVQVKGREVEVIDGWSGVNCYQAEESEDQCEGKRQSVEGNGQIKACEQRILGFEEQKEGRQGLIEEVQEESQNFNGQIEVVEDVNEAKAMPAEVAQEQRAEERKQPEMTEQQIKVLKDDIPQHMMKEEKKYVEQLHQTKGADGVMKSNVVMIGEQEQPQRGKMSSEQGLPQDQQVDITSKMVFLCDGEDGEKLKTPLGKCSMHPLEEEKMEALEHEGQQRRKLHQGERDLFIVCDLQAQQQSQLRTHIYQKAHKLHTDSISASCESRESGQILVKKLKLSPQRPSELPVTTSEGFTQSKQKPTKIYTRREVQNSQLKVKTYLGMSKNIEELEKKQEEELQKPEKLLELESKTKEAKFGGEEAAVSLSIEVKDSMNAPLDLEQHGREHQKRQIKVYVRRNVSKSQLKEPEISNIFPSNSE
ncbi:hypothetical protein SCA6_007692 [Theobroma cacao]